MIGWKYIFYIFGSTGFLWCLIWIIFGSNSAQECKFISEDELSYIYLHQKTSISQRFVPWRDIFTSTAVWAIIITNFTMNWGFYILLTWLPTYLEKELLFDLKHSGSLNFLPYVAQFVVTVISGRSADGLIEKGVSVTLVRKCYQTVASLFPAIFLILLCTKPTPYAAVAYMICAIGIAATSVAGYGINHLDIGPNYSGILLGISNTSGTLPGIVGVLLTGYILDQTHSWCLVFIITASVYVFGGLVWLLFASGKLVLP